jgi:hypothetical protein
MTFSEAFTVLPNQSNPIATIRNRILLQAATAESASSSSSLLSSNASQKNQQNIKVQIAIEEDEVIGTRPRIVEINSAEDFKAFIESEDPKDDRLAIVK